MFIIKSLRREKKDSWTRIVVDYEVTDGKRPFGCQDALWFVVENEHSDKRLC